ncbi:MAG: family 2 glycosyl transferase [Parcubacteria group bacterium Gr01-1014_38]|nr:MAG: family 2 glycosyl transferase [Parcubacteria group bacterium Gr01-1014_38]
MKLVILIPALNEAATIAHVIQEIPKSFLDIAGHEVVVIDDGSTDTTVTEARAAGATVISHGANRGVGVAFRTGLTEALKRGADVMVHVDADGQFNPADIPALLQPLVEHRADITTCTRFKRPELQPTMPPIKVWGNRMVTRIVNAATGQRFTDVSCGYRALTREAALRLTLFGRFTYTQEMFLDAAQKDLRIVEVPLRVRGEREVGRSRVYTNAWNYAVRSAAILFRAVRDTSPLQVFGFVAVILGGLGILSGGFVFTHWLRTGQTFPYRSMVTLASVLVLLSAFFATIALLADMLRRQRKILEEMLYYARREFFDRHRTPPPPPASS